MDITQLILDDHAEFRRLFAMIEQIGRSDIEAAAAIWKRLGALLDTHAEAEERFFYPELLRVGSGAGDADSAPGETKDAIEDHNDIRDAAAAVDKEKPGTKKWFDAIDAANLANSKHMAEEERQGLTDFRRNAPLDTRHRLGVQFAGFEAAHLTGVAPVNKDPKAYVASGGKEEELMAAPIVIDIPHKLTREEVRRRLTSRIGELPAHIPGGVAEVRSAWPTPDRMTLEVSAMGQTISATLDIDDRAVHASFTLPPMLSFLSGAITAAIRSKGEQLLLGDR